ncbi:sulfite exporter TauE/SafE family protein [Fulvimarina sp. 2208YS6-2-32]|uniref:Probable membrane transporter protein n=1 Tax=Fulvimarina uroteuthidis TaxID=3098149 RepID=A0ABU5I6Y4_9HYPH|nr:sulfite exporter TauE/SafE family protein [Fulvimarina sp. 2208YS6-2-32]MDY8111150.1 sulfite exporter TauE/SafE family protein [Fulvimarina sp. 2208YS6-2-32]
MTAVSYTLATATGSGGLVGIVLGLFGGGGSILAVPLLVYVVGIALPHVAIGTSAVAVAFSALGNLVPQARAGRVKWRCAGVFALAGIVGSLAGAAAAKAVDGERLMALFGLVMIGVGLAMMRQKASAGDPQVRLSWETAPRLLPLLIGIGFTVGLFSGFFGIGGGFLIVPGLILATGMPLTYAIGTSLVGVGAFGAATASSYAVSGLVDWTIAAVFVIGGLVGGWVGTTLGARIAARKKVLSLAFAVLVVAVGLFIVAKGLPALFG